MPRTYAISDLTARIRKRVDMEGDDTISDAEFADLISEAYGELYTIVVESGMGYFYSTQQFTTTGVNTLTAPTDIMTLVTLAYLVDATSGRYWPLRPIMEQERVNFSGLNVTGGSRAVAYVQDGQTIYLYPTPPSGQTYELRYVPQPPDLTTASSAIDVVTPDGLSFLVWNVAMMALAKTEQDPTLTLQRLEAARDRFTESVQLRALHNPQRRIVDVEMEHLSPWDESF